MCTNASCKLDWEAPGGTKLVGETENYFVDCDTTGWIGKKREESVRGNTVCYSPYIEGIKNLTESNRSCK